MERSISWVSTFSATGAAPIPRKMAEAQSTTGTTLRKKGMRILSAEPNGSTNSSDLMIVTKAEHNPPLAISRFDGSQPPKVSFAIRGFQTSRRSHQTSVPSRWRSFGGSCGIGWKGILHLESRDPVGQLREEMSGSESGRDEMFRSETDSRAQKIPTS